MYTKLPTLRRALRSARAVIDKHVDEGRAVKVVGGIELHRSQRGLQYSILNVSTAYLIALGERVEVDVGTQRRPRMQLHLPDPHAFRLPWQLK